MTDLVQALPARLKDWHDLTWVVGHPPAGHHRGWKMTDQALAEIWSANRRLSQAWTSELALWLQDSRCLGMRTAVSKFERLAAELFMFEMAFRVFATALCGIECERLKAVEDPATKAVLRPILEHGLQQIEHPRRQMLHELVQMGELLAGVDRLRRRCERWTDLLIGPWIVRQGVASFAHDPRRAWDYGEDSLLDFELPFQRDLLYRSYVEAFRGRMLEGWYDKPELRLIYFHISSLTGSAPRNGKVAETAETNEPPATDVCTGPSSLLEQCLRRVPPSTTE